MKPHSLCIALVAGLVGCSETRLCRCPPPLGPQLPANAAGALGEAGYTLGCADVLEVAFLDRPAWDCAASVGLDGRLPLGDAGSPLVQGKTPDEARAAIAAAAGVEPARVTVMLAEYRAGRVYVTGPENKLRRTMPFRGPEPVLEFLWRSGATKPGSAELRDVRVLRPTVAVGGRPEAFRVDAEAIVLGNRGLGHVKSFLLGSVSHAVLQHADRAVLIVPAPEEARERRERRAAATATATA